MKLSKVLIAGAMVAILAATSVAAKGGITRIKTTSNYTNLDINALATSGIRSLGNFNYRQCIDQSASYINNTEGLISAWMFLPLLGSCNGLDDLMYESQRAYCSGSTNGATREWRSRPGRYSAGLGTTLGHPDREYTVWVGIGRCWHKRVIQPGDTLRCNTSNFGDPARNSNRMNAEWVDLQGRKQTRSDTYGAMYNELGWTVRCRYNQVTMSDGVLSGGFF